MSSRPGMRNCRPRRCLSPSPYMCYDSPRCSPCPPRCYSTSPSRHRHRSKPSRCYVPQRDLKSGRMTCDRFASVCYPRNLADCWGSVAGDRGCLTPRCRRAPTGCAPTCYRSPYTPTVCPRGICRSNCRCTSPPPASCCSPCSPCGDVCEQDPSDRFVQAMKNTGPCTRYQSHLCPWEADVTVSGTIRAHCTSTADEISNRLAGPFKAFGKRFTTDSESKNGPCEPCDQRLSLGMLDDGGNLDFSRNNRPSPDGSNLDHRVSRIMNGTTASNIHKRTSSSSGKDLQVRDNHISWDSSLDYNDSHDYKSSRFSKDRSSLLMGKSSLSGRNRLGLNMGRFGDGDGEYARRRRRSSSRDPSFEGERLHSGSRRDERRYFGDGKLRSDEDGFRSEVLRSSRDDSKNPSFEIMMNKRRTANEGRRYNNYTPTRSICNRPQTDTECEERSKIRTKSRFYESSRGGVDSDDEERFVPSRYRPRRRSDYDRMDRSRNHYPHPHPHPPDARGGVVGEDGGRMRHGHRDDSRNHRPTTYYDSGCGYGAASKMNSDGRDGTFAAAPDYSSSFRVQKDMDDLERIRFWPFGGDRQN